MGLFTNRVHVNVHGRRNRDAGADGRYEKQVMTAKRAEKKKEKNLKLEPHTAAELRGYIEETYDVTELPVQDERFQMAFMGIKAQLISEYAPELLREEEAEARWQEAVRVPLSDFPIHLHVYSIPIRALNCQIAWLEVYVESDHDYLAFRTVKLEFDEHYSIDQVRNDIIRYFGASDMDQKKKNERYLQYLNAL